MYRTYHNDFFIIREWDDTTALVRYDSDQGDVRMTYSDGDTHIIDREYAEQLIVRRAFDFELNVHNKY